MTKEVFIFALISLINVFGSTIKTYATIKSGRATAAIANSIYYGFYTIVLVFMVSDGIPLWLRAVITGVTNYIGVYLGSILFDKVTKDINWKVEVSIPNMAVNNFIDALDFSNLDYYCAGSSQGWHCYAIFCHNKEESRKLREILPKNAKYNIVESVKTL